MNNSKEKRAAEAVGRVGRLSRARVSRSALSVVGGLLARGGFFMFCTVDYGTTYFVGIAQQLGIFFAS